MTEPTGEDPPWLTVVIPTHEGERWLAATLESLAAQTERGFTCILIDSSATDATVRIAEGFRDRLRLDILRRTDVRHWTQKTNLGVGRSRTTHVCMLHQDDVWLPDRAKAIRCWLAAAPDVVMHLHPTWIIDERNRRLGLWRCPLPSRTDIPEAMFRERLIVQNFVAICAPVMRRDAFLAVGGLDPELWYTADWDLYLKLGRQGPVAYHAEPLAGFRIHTASQTVTGSRRAEDFSAQMTTVLHRHEAGIAASALRRAQAAIAVNAALAAALHDQRSGLVGAVCRVLALGPRGTYLFLRDTRLIERVLPRLRAQLKAASRRKLTMAA